MNVKNLKPLLLTLLLLPSCVQSISEAESREHSAILDRSNLSDPDVVTLLNKEYEFVEGNLKGRGQKLISQSNLYKILNESK